MSVAAAFFAVLAAVAGWWLSRQGLLTKPWLEQGLAHDLPDARSQPAARVGLWMFLAVAGSLFALLLSAYSMRAGMAEMGMTPARPLPVPDVLWLNTGLLILSSAALEWARSAARLARMDRVRLGLLAGALFALAFLQGQLVAWGQLRAGGICWRPTRPPPSSISSAPCMGCICSAASPQWPGRPPGCVMALGWNRRG